MATFFVIVLLWHPTIINYSFSLFMCTQYEDGYKYLKKDTTIRCWHGKDFVFQVVIGATFIIIWAIFFPLAIFYRINQEKGRLNHPNNLKLYGIFYIGLSDNSFYWEIIVLNIRKIAIIVVSTFFSSSKSSLKVNLNNLTDHDCRGTSESWQFFCRGIWVTTQRHLLILDLTKLKT